MNKIFLLIIAISSSIFASTDIKSLDIFTNKTLVNQKIDISKNSVELLGQVRLEDIRFKLNSTCEVNSTELKNEKFRDDTLSLKIEDLQFKINSKENKMKALKSNIAFLERTSLTNISTTKSLKNTSSFIKNEIMENHNLIYQLQKDIKEKNEELKELIKKRTNTKFSKLTYDISCANKKDLMISYPIYNMQRNGFYEINYDSSKKDINIKNLSFITQSTGVDFKNIDIKLYTYNYTNQVVPNNFRPEYLDIYEEKAIQTYESAPMLDSISMKKSVRVNTLIKPSFAYVEDSTKSFFKASNVNLVSGKKTEVVFAKDSYKATNSLEIDAYSSSQAFYKVDFKSKKLYGVLNAKLYLDGTYIGRTNLKEIKKDKKSSIYFGTNRFIDVKKELIRDIKEEPFFSLNKLKTQKEWNFKITNNQNKKQKIVLLERLPISKHEDIEVKLIGKTKETKVDKNGKIYFEFELKANETKEINFAYEILKPVKK